MKAFLKNTACSLILVLTSISTPAYAGNDLKPAKVKRDIRQECRKQKGACSSYRIKDYKLPDKFKANRPGVRRSYK